MPKPDESRLLTDQQLRDLQDEGLVYPEDAVILQRDTAKAQDAKTASIKDTECQIRVDRVFKKIEADMGEDTTGYRDGHISYKTIPTGRWQALKKQEGG